MISIQEILTSLIYKKKEIDLKKLPSMGLFYADGFKIMIKRASKQDIIEYETGYKKEDIGDVIQRIKNIVKKNIEVSNSFSFLDVKSVDIIFLFLEIVKHTTDKPIRVPYYDSLNKVSYLEFNPDNFNYADISKEKEESYDSVSKEFIIDEYRYSVPSVGAETSLTNYLLSKTEKWGEYNYDFLYFLGNKNKLTEKEIENLIVIFNYDITEVESKKVGRIIRMFSNIGRYSLKRKNQIVDMTSKLELDAIWKLL